MECSEPPEDSEHQPIRFERRVEPIQPQLQQESTTAVPELHFDLYTRQSLDREEGAPIRLARLICWDGVGGGAGLGETNDYIFGGGSVTSSSNDRASVRLTSTLTLSIDIQDRNDNAPIFTQSAFTAELEENGDIRKEIIQVS